MIMYAKKERAKYWPVSSELMAQYHDGSHTYENSYGLWWYQNDQLHRDGDLPAVINANGNLHWYQNGQRHRDGDKPAVIAANGHLEWLKNGQWHRFSGPAVIYKDGKQEWWINGQDITKDVRTWLNRKRWKGTPEQIVEFKLRFHRSFT